MATIHHEMSLDTDVHRITTAEYERMISLGALEDVRVELLDGFLVDMSPQDELHYRLIREFARLFGARAELVRTQAPLPLADGWMPEPDVALVAMDESDWRRRPEGALLVVEIALSSHLRDRRKASAYAAAGIPGYWLVDVAGEAVFEHTDPRPDGYGVVRRLSGDDVLDTGVEGIPGTTVAELLRGTA